MKDVEILEKDMKEINTNIQSLRNQYYVLNKSYIELKKKECEEYIGKCFNKEKKYYMIIDTDDIIYSMYREPSFNQYQYKVIEFEYPYNNSFVPINKTKIFFNFKNNKINELEEISKEEFLLKLSKINHDWLMKIKQ